MQWVLGHAHLSTTEIYMTPLTDDVIAAVLAHHARRAGPGAGGPADQRPTSPLSYRPETLNVLFGEGTA